jgi:hypothetical protein
MSNELMTTKSHPEGEPPTVLLGDMARSVVDSYAGKIHVEWDPDLPMTPLGQLPFFIDYLKAAGLFDAWVADCPLNYTSPNGSEKRDICGTIVLSALAGHWRYAHMAALRSDAVLPELLGMKRVRSEDTVRRGLKAMDEKEAIDWLESHLDFCTMPLLREPWVCDIDTTVKPLYGHQQGAEIGYNPQKPGRPSHAYHTYMIGTLRLILNVDVHAGNETASSHTAPGLWALLDRLGRDRWPTLIRGDAGFGNEAIMFEAERRNLHYLFKLRLTANVKRALKKMMQQTGWTDAGQGWEGAKSTLRLTGWSRARQVIMLRRRLENVAAMTASNDSKQALLGFVDVLPGREMYEYAVLVSSLDEEVLTFGQLYRDRADCENNFDELKNQWGWGGFTTHDLKRCQIMSRSVALIYNWWNIFVRMVEPDRHMEAITSRPLLMHAIAARISHAGQTTLRIASQHAKASWAAAALSKVAAFLRALINNAEQLTTSQKWCRMLSYAFQKYLKGRQLDPPLQLVAA